VKRSDLKGDSGLRQRGPQEVDICALVRPITKYAVTITDPADVRRHLETAVNLSQSGRPGPVWIDVPLDVQAASVDPAVLVGAGDAWMTLDPTWANVVSPAALTDAASEVADRLREAKRPVILAGNGIRVSRAVDAFRDLVRTTGAPVLTTRLGVDLLPASAPECMGMPGTIASRAANFTLQNCDFLLVIGARLDSNLVAHNPAFLARGARKVMVNIDLPELDRLRETVDMTICADAGAFVRALRVALGSAKLQIDEWLVRCRQWQGRYPFIDGASMSGARAIGALSMYRFTQLLSDELSEGDVVLPGSSGSACEVFLTGLRVKADQRVFHNKGTGAMGFGPPASIGASLAANGRRVVCIDGDGGFQFNVQELETIRRMALPVKLFVINNSGYASIRQSQRHHFGRVAGADTSSAFSLPDILRVASAYGVRTCQITDERSAASIIGDVLASDGPAVCEVIVAPDEERRPRVQSMVMPDGSVVSKPLEDMWPYLDRDEFLENMIVPPLP
jgi:acetolactate synthase-1/2/3 large subunit